MAIEAVLEEESESPSGGTCGSLEIDRDRLLSLLDEVIQATHAKIMRGRIRDEKKEKLRLEMVRVLAYLCSVYNTILRDQSLCDFEARLLEVEELLKEEKESLVKCH